MLGNYIRAVMAGLSAGYAHGDCFTPPCRRDRKIHILANADGTTSRPEGELYSAARRSMFHQLLVAKTLTTLGECQRNYIAPTMGSSEGSAPL